LKKIDDNNNNTQEEKSQEINENVQPISLESLSLDENNQKKEDSNNKITPPNRLGGRRSRFRLYRHLSPKSEEPISEDIVHFFYTY